MLIRQAVPQDIPRLLALAQQSDSAAHWTQREYEALFAPDAPRRLALVAVKQAESEIVGFVVALCQFGEWEIENVVVATESRRQGIALSLVREFLEKAGTAKAEAVLLEVRESNVAARQLYAKLGFTEYARRARYYDRPAEDAILLRRELHQCDKTP